MTAKWLILYMLQEEIAAANANGVIGNRYRNQAGW